MCCDIGLERRIPNCRDPPYVLLYRIQEDPGLLGSSGHYLCGVI